MGTCGCGFDVGVEGGDQVCPACLLRLGLETQAGEPVERAPPRLLGPVGCGPHGTVHLAARPDDEPQLVTVKVVETTTDVDRFGARLRETADRLASLARMGFAEIIDVGVTASGNPYVVAGYVPGPSLADYAASHRARPANRVQVAARLCTLVADLHTNGLAHGSIKPSNVIVAETRDGPSPVLLDVGFVPALGNDDAADAGRGHWIERDARDLHDVLAGLLPDLAGLVEGSESPAALADMFAHRAG